MLSTGYCIILSIVFISFTVGYTVGYFKFKKEEDVYQEIPIRIRNPAPKKEKDVYSSHRFHQSIKSDSCESEDYDNKVISRMKKEPTYDI